MMTKKFSNKIDSTDNELQKLKNILDIYGAESEKWPENERGKLIKFVAGDKLAQTLFLEAKALDELMSSIPAAEVPDDLNHRIISSVSDSEQSSHHALDIPKDSVVRLSSYQRESKEVSSGKNIIATTALMAASLMIGIFIGYSKISPLSDLSSTETEMATLGNTEQSDLSSSLTQQSLEESLSFTEELL